MKASEQLTRKELLAIWGCLESHKNYNEQCARDAAKRTDDAGRQLAGSFMQRALEIVPLQDKILQLANDMK